MTQTALLHHGDGTRSLRVRWVLEELDVPYEIAPVLFPPRARQPAYLTVNPLGSLPFFTDGEVRLSESMAICEYLVAKHGPSPLAVDPDEDGFADYRQFCWYGEATLMPPVGVLVRQMLLTPPDQRQADLIADAGETLSLRLRPVANALSQAEHLAAGRFTLADVSVIYALGLAALLGGGPSFPPEITACHERLTARPAYVRASARTVALPSVSEVR